MEYIEKERGGNRLDQIINYSIEDPNEKQQQNEQAQAQLEQFNKNKPEVEHIEPPPIVHQEPIEPDMDNGVIILTIVLALFIFGLIVTLIYLYSVRKNVIQDNESV